MLKSSNKYQHMAFKQQATNLINTALCIPALPTTPAMDRATREAQTVACHVDRELYVRAAMMHGVTDIELLSTQHDQQTSYFWKLPAEIRNRIYYLAFRSMVLRVLSPLGSLSVPWTELDVAILSTCRQIYYDASVILCELAEIRIVEFDKLESFFSCVHTKYRPHIQSVTIWWPSFRRNYTSRLHFGSPLIRCQQPFPNLENVVVQMGRHDMDPRELMVAKSTQVYSKGSERNKDSKDQSDISALNDDFRIR
jgi:hypothetical protein